MTTNQSEVDNWRRSEDMCGFNRPRDPYKIKDRRYLRQISRVETFKNWPQQLSQTPEELADAGFVYKNVSDHVKCVSCKLRLGGWQPQDDPLEEHVKYSNSCEYLQHYKGGDFIEELTKKLLDTPSTDEQQPDVHLDAPFGICKVCCNEKSRVMFIPCGHMVTCANCAPKIKKCIYCSHKIDRYQKVYL